MTIVKRKHPSTKKWKRSVKLLFKKSFNNRSEHHMPHHFLKMNCSRWCWQTQFLSIVGLGKGNEMKLKSRLPPFSFICIWCQCSFCFWFYSLLPLSKFWYTLTVRLGILGHSKFYVWDCVLYRLTRNYHWLVWQDMQFLASLTHRQILLPDMGLLGL